MTIKCPTVTPSGRFEYFSIVISSCDDIMNFLCSASPEINRFELSTDNLVSVYRFQMNTVQYTAYNFPSSWKSELTQSSIYRTIPSASREPTTVEIKIGKRNIMSVVMCKYVGPWLVHCVVLLRRWQMRGWKIILDQENSNEKFMFRDGIEHSWT